MKRKRITPAINRKRKRKSSFRKKVIRAKFRRKKRMFRKKVKAIARRVMKCGEDFGTFINHFSGCIKPSSSSGANVAFWTNGGQRYTTSYVTDNLKLLLPFNVKKLIDAASVLYGAKATTNWTDSTDNFGYNSKIEFSRCTWHMELRNNGYNVLYVEIFEVTRKASSDANALSLWDTAMQAEPWIGGSPTFTRTDDQAVVDSSQYPNGSSGFKRQMTCKKVKGVRLEPGQHTFLNYKFSGCVDFTKFKSGTFMTTYNPRIGKEILLRITGELMLDTTVNEHQPGRQILQANPTNDTSSGLAVDVWERYTVMQPENTADAKEGMKKLVNHYGQATAGRTLQGALACSSNPIVGANSG